MGQGPHCDAPVLISRACRSGPTRRRRDQSHNYTPTHDPITHPSHQSGPAATCRALPLVLEPPQHGPDRAGCLAAG